MKTKNCTEAVILAGGLGTRLRTEVPELPKCMAPVAGKPFIDHVMLHLKNHGVSHFVFALGYMSDILIEHLIATYQDQLEMSIAVEEQPLGTGGAIKYAAQFVKGNAFFALNGDSLFAMNPQNLKFTGSEMCVVGLKSMENFARYGTVVMDENNVITSFIEKMSVDKGLINGGLYLLDKKRLMSLDLPEKFSFEKDFLEVFCKDKAIKGSIEDAYFIDIGVPEDFRKANIDLAQ